MKSARGRSACVAIATCFYLSYIPVKIARLFRAEGGETGNRWTGSGFAGTLAGWAVLYALPGRPAAYGLLVALACAAACWVSGIAEEELGRRDDPRIIIDEVVGYWVAVAFLPRSWKLLAAGFVLFRFLDTVKLPPYKSLENLPGGAGVVMDDVGAGIVANLCLRLIGLWAPW